MTDTGRNNLFQKFGGAIALAALAIVSLGVYFASLADYAFPGENAHLLALWKGLDATSAVKYPLMEWAVKSLVVSNTVAPVLGALAVVLFAFLSFRFLSMRLGNASVAERSTAMTGAGVAAVVFMLTPAVREAATHLEPRLFAFVWVLLTIAVAGLAGVLPKFLAWMVPIIVGAMSGLGLCDSPLSLALLPLAVAVFWQACDQRNGSKPWGGTVLLVFSFLVAFFWFAASVSGDLATFLRTVKGSFSEYTGSEGWLFVTIFATVPFFVSLFASARSLSGKASLTQWLFHGALLVVTILSVATPLSPSSLMAPYAVLPVATSAFAAFVAGYLVAYWWRQRGTVRYLAYGMGGLLATVVAITLVLNLFNFEKDRGAFADRIAEKVISDLDGRTWLVTDGALDDHLRLAAARMGKELHLICLQRDFDTDYLERLAELVRTLGVGGERNSELSLSLSLGVLPFVQDWFATDPDIGGKVAVWGAADLLYASGKPCVPEFLFFGADDARQPDWEKDWAECKELLHAPEGWGSYKLSRNKNTVDRLRLDLRRHLGHVANNRGVWLQDHSRDEEAFSLYELVLGDIDADNICALFNEFELARTGEKHAAAKRRHLESKLKAVADDRDRRYRLWALGNYYGYIRSPEIFVRLGFNWARSGRPGEALQQIRRAIDFVPTDKRGSLMNMIAAIYASGDDRAKSREVYAGVLEKDAENHDALIGMMRLELMDGNSAKALEYLERATAAAGDDPRAIIEVAMLHMMRGELTEAKQKLRKVTDADASNLQAWSFLAAVTMQQVDAAKDEATKAVLMKELEEGILHAMEKQARDPSDYYVQTTRAFVLLRQGEAKRREARDALIVASRERPDIAATSDLVLSLDISLNDTVDAERHARDVLRRNRRAPLANYVMGSLALQKGEYAEAEAFLRRSADAQKPVTLALNDLAEVLRRSGKLDEAELYARRAVEADPKLYVAWDTLATIILERKGSLDEAEECVRKACELSRDDNGVERDVRMLISLARVQFAKGDKMRARGTLRKVNTRIDELSPFERTEFEELQNSVK